MNSTPVLICGAGPTGLVLALWLTKSGVQVRIIDTAERPGTTSRAIVIQARNLEFYHQMGIDVNAVKNGIEFNTANLWINGKRKAAVHFGDAAGDISPYPYLLIFPQDRHEQMLVDELAKLNVLVERNTELISVTQTGNGIEALLKKQGGQQETCHTIYLAGCDGAHSIVRSQVGARFPGGTYQNTFYVADLHASGPSVNGEMNIAIDEADFLAQFPMQGAGNVRLVGTVQQQDQDKKELTWNDVSQGIITRLQMQVNEVRWFSTYKAHHRVASFFRKDNMFLLGDAGHLHSPVGGQGMNTGIGDAINLGWKIAAIIKNNAPATLLDTYEPERIPFAKKLVATTDNAFVFMDHRRPIASFIRTRVAPLILPLLFHIKALRRAMFRLLSQTQINYRQSALSIGASSRLKAGDRLPWVKLSNNTDNYQPLTSMQWQVHIYGNIKPGLQKYLSAKNINSHVFEYTNVMKAKGIKPNAAYLIRPDGYTGLLSDSQDVEDFEAYCTSWNINFA